MNKTFRKIFFCFIFLSSFLLWQKAEAAISWSGNICTATDSTVADVQSCVDEAANKTGEVTIIIPGSATWSTASPVIIDMTSWTTPTNLIIAGAGTSTTVLTLSGGVYGFQITTKDGIKFELKDIAFSMSSASGYGAINIYRGNGGYTNPATEGFRIHDCSFSSTAFRDAVDIKFSLARGVIDNNIFSGVRVGYLGVNGAPNISDLTTEDLEWSSDTGLGTGQFVFVENNTINGGTSYLTNAFDANGAGKFVFRYNTVTDTYLESHSGCQNGNRGVRAFEIYNNSLIVTENIPTAAKAFTAEFKSGMGVIYNNVQTGLYNINGILISNMPSCMTSNVHYCGNSDLETRAMRTTDGYNTDWTLAVPLEPSCSVYPCQDQVGAGKDAGWGTAQNLEGLYAWNNTYSGGNLNIAVNPTTCENVAETFLHADRDYFNASSISDAKSKGLAADYAPYACPHPLTGLSGSCDSNVAGTIGYNITSSDITPPAAPSNLSVQ